jgi:hypothetical protein
VVAGGEPLESASTIEALVTTFLRDAEVEGQFPTPLETLVRSRDLRIVRGVDPLALFAAPTLAAAPAPLRRRIAAVRGRTLGALDRSARIIHLPRSRSGRTVTTRVTETLQERFLIAHELGHDVLPWHQDALYLDNDAQLLPHARALFEREANYFAAALLLQSPLHGRALSRALTTGGLAALWRIADARGVSRHATIWHAVERYRGVAMALELDARVLGGAGLPYRFRVRACFASPHCASRFPQLTSTRGGDTAILSTAHDPALAAAWETFQGRGANQIAQWIQRDCRGSEHVLRLEFGANHYAYFLLLTAGTDGKQSSVTRRAPRRTRR